MLLQPLKLSQKLFTLNMVGWPKTPPDVVATFILSLFWSSHKTNDKKQVTRKILCFILMIIIHSQTKDTSKQNYA